jgi:hypothetical protein
MNSTGLNLFAARCNMFDYSSERVLAAMVPPCGVPEPDVRRTSIENQITDFLDGRTHGEGLLHALYDHVLDEPIPERMRSLFKK